MKFQNILFLWLTRVCNDEITLIESGIKGERKISTLKWFGPWILKTPWVFFNITVLKNIKITEIQNEKFPDISSSSQNNDLFIDVVLVHPYIWFVHIVIPQLAFYIIHFCSTLSHNNFFPFVSLIFFLSTPLDYNQC